jgi:hypothetical protein
LPGWIPRDTRAAASSAARRRAVSAPQQVQQTVVTVASRSEPPIRHGLSHLLNFHVSDVRELQQLLHCSGGLKRHRARVFGRSASGCGGCQSAPLLAAALPGSAAGLARGPDDQLTARGRRQQSLRGFSPAGRSPAVRVAYTRAMASQWRLTALAAVPFPGEFSLPLNAEARIEASSELEMDPKGIVVESYVRRGFTSFGGHGFYDTRDRYLANAVSAGRQGHLYWTAIAGVEKASASSSARGRWSMEAEYLPHPFVGLGGRLENRAGDQAAATFAPYFRSQFHGSRYTTYIAIERRFHRGNNATLLEVGTVF